MRGHHPLAIQVDQVPDTVMRVYLNEAAAKKSPFTTAGPLKTFADVEAVTFGLLDCYSNRRLHSSLGSLTPEEYERNYCADTSALLNNEAANKTVT